MPGFKCSLYLVCIVRELRVGAYNSLLKRKKVGGGGGGGGGGGNEVKLSIAEPPRAEVHDV